MGLGYFNGEYMDYINESAKKYKYESINWNDYLDAQLNIPQVMAEKLGINTIWTNETNSYSVHSEVGVVDPKNYKCCADTSGKYDPVVPNPLYNHRAPVRRVFKDDKGINRLYPTVTEIRSKISKEINVKENLALYKYNDGYCVCMRAVDLKDVDVVKNGFRTGLADTVAICELTDEVHEFYKKKFIEEEMKMSMEQYNNLCRLIKSLGGTVDLDYSQYERCRINLPIEKLKWIKVVLPETNFDKYKIPNKWGYEGTDIPPVVNVETYNNRVVKVTFADGSFTKSVCSENDTFDLDVGISVCITKRMMGKDGHKNYNNMMRKVHEQMIKNAKDEVAKKAKIQEEKEKRKKANERKAEKKDRAKKEIIDIQKTAMLSALEEFHSKTGDDGK